jgi:hypothetical protein
LKKTRVKKEVEPVVCNIEPLSDEDPYEDDWRPVCTGDKDPKWASICPIPKGGGDVDA